MSKWIKIAILLIIIPALLFSISTFFIDWNILIKIFVFVRKSMKSFDWLIAYNAQITVFGLFLTIELALLIFNLARWIINLIAGSGKE
jgi:hypothetical protein